MDRKSVESSHIAEIGYESESSTLEVQFKSGQVWQYYDVPETVWNEFDASDSKGKFFGREIKGHYREAQVG